MMVGVPCRPNHAAGTDTISFAVSHNYFAQTHGRKRFRLWGPEHHWELKVFPDAHPRARKSQVDIDTTSIPPPLLDVTLEVGDALVIPAFWFHHVEALGDISVSVNVFSEAGPKLAAAQVLSVYEPASLVLASTQGDVLATQFQRTVQALCSLAGIEDHNFLRRLVESRYDLLDHVSPSSGETARQSEVLQEETEVDYSKFLLPEFLEDLPSERHTTNSAVTVDDIVAELDYTRPAFDRLVQSCGDDKTYCRGLVEITLCHLVELWAVRTVQAAGVEKLLRDAAACESR